MRNIIVVITCVAALAVLGILLSQVRHLNKRLDVSLFELHRLSERLDEISHHEFHDHAEVREFVIRAALADADSPIVVFGDSITEMAPLPRELCGHSVVNAGIGGIGAWEAARIAARLFVFRPPFMIVIAFGANDIGSKSLQRSYAELLGVMATISPRLLLISDTSDEETNREIGAAAAEAGLRYINPELPPDTKMVDGTHFKAAAYRVWLPALQDGIVRQCD